MLDFGQMWFKKIDFGRFSSMIIDFGQKWLKVDEIFDLFLSVVESCLTVR
jgi:hypothetical protein